MNKITAGHADSQSLDVVTENIEKLKALFPTIVKEGKLDVEELKALLGDYVETSDEFYRFTWAGKAMARQEANKPSTATLRPNKEESKDWDTTENIFIEGDNLEVLKLLQKSYASKVKMIYIDPPYNTGRDFVYKDNYADNLGNYLAITGQTDDEGRKLGTNSDTDGRYHSNWLNMMYPRLKLARNLLKDDGVIFISIDENEVQNLRKICDEIFGEENHICTLVWQSKKGGGSDSKTVVIDHEYVVCFAKNSSFTTLGVVELTAEPLDREDKNGKYRRGRELNKWGANSRRADRPTMWFPITGPNGEEVYPIKNDGEEGCWRFGYYSMMDFVKNGDIDFVLRSDGNYTAYEKIRNEDPRSKPYRTWVTDVNATSEGSIEVRELFEGKKVFDFAKPISLLQRCLAIGTTANDIVLDFFAGSASIVQAIFDLNNNEKKDVKFICVQLPEVTDENSEAYKANYKTIADITKERIRRAGEKIKAEAKTDLFSDPDKKLDIGFKAFKLDSSNINAWDGSIADFERNLFNSADNIKAGRTEEDVLYEILLKNGLDLTLPITTQTIAGKTVYNIGEGALFICLANGITTTVAEGIGKWKETLQPATCKVIFKDNGFTDVEKTNSIQILKRYGIVEVNSI